MNFTYYIRTKSSRVYVGANRLPLCPKKPMPSRAEKNEASVSGSVAYYRGCEMLPLDYWCDN
jgi:hypothetical protein